MRIPSTGAAFIGVILLINTHADAQQSEAVPPRSATLAQQKMCDEQARKKFHEDNQDVPPHERGQYTSHFDAAGNVCYMLVHHAGTGNGVPSVSDLVYDAFEGREYASYTWVNTQKKKYWEVAPMECKVKPRGKAEITCKSSAEFEGLIEKYFGVAK
jgi:hypothetical protein